MMGVLLALGILVIGCQKRGAAGATPHSEGAPIEYSFGTIDGEVERSSAHRGRVTVLLFLTTFDVMSQASAKRLEDLARSHAPRINALGVVLEAPQYVELVRSFREVLGLSYPLALSEIGRLRTQGMLGAVQTVPAWVFLDRSGRIRFAGSGALTMEQLEQAVRTAEE